MEISELRLKAFMTASAAHATKTYRGKPYFTHLYDVYNILIQYGFEKNETLMTASILHDLQEDCGWTYNDIKKDFGVEVADLVYLVTDFKGHNRDERKPDQLYIEMKEKTLAVILKVADRLANARASVLNGDFMGSVYKKEYAHFREMLYSPSYITPMWHELDELMNFKTLKDE